MFTGKLVDIKEKWQLLRKLLQTLRQVRVIKKGGAITETGLPNEDGASLLEDLLTVSLYKLKEPWREHKGLLLPGAMVDGIIIRGTILNLAFIVLHSTAYLHTLSLLLSSLPALHP